MKSITACGFALAGVVASVLVSGHALAASTVYAGSVCHNYFSQDVSEFEFYGHGITNSSPKANDAKKVICPVSKRLNDANGVSVRVNLKALRPSTIICTLYSYNWNRKLLGSKTVGNRSAGKEESLTIRVPSSTTRSYSSAVCSLPSKEAGEIYSIEMLN